MNLHKGFVSAKLVDNLFIKLFLVIQKIILPNTLPSRKFSIFFLYKSNPLRITSSLCFLVNSFVSKIGLLSRYEIFSKYESGGTKKLACCIAHSKDSVPG